MSRFTDRLSITKSYWARRTCFYSFLLFAYTRPNSLVERIKILQHLIVNESLNTIILIVDEAEHGAPTGWLTCEPLRLNLILRILSPRLHNSLSFDHLVNRMRGPHIFIELRITKMHVLLRVHLIAVRGVEEIKFVLQFSIRRDWTHLV